MLYSYIFPLNVRKDLLYKAKTPPCVSQFWIFRKFHFLTHSWHCSFMAHNHHNHFRGTQLVILTKNICFALVFYFFMRLSPVCFIVTFSFALQAISSFLSFSWLPNIPKTPHNYTYTGILSHNFHVQIYNQTIFTYSSGNNVPWVSTECRKLFITPRGKHSQERRCPRQKLSHDRR